VGWIQNVQDRGLKWGFVSQVMSFQRQWKVETLFTWPTISSSRIILSHEVSYLNADLYFRYMRRYNFDIIISLIPLACQSKLHMLLGRSNTGVVGSNPRVGLGVYQLLSVLSSDVTSFVWSDSPPKESCILYLVFYYVHSFRNLWKFWSRKYHYSRFFLVYLPISSVFYR
jgi:hypothetical protein